MLVYFPLENDHSPTDHINYNRECMGAYQPIGIKLQLGIHVSQ